MELMIGIVVFSVMLHIVIKILLGVLHVERTTNRDVAKSKNSDRDRTR